MPWLFHVCLSQLIRWYFLMVPHDGRVQHKSRTDHENRFEFNSAAAQQHLQPSFNLKIVAAHSKHEIWHLALADYFILCNQGSKFATFSAKTSCKVLSQAPAWASLWSPLSHPLFAFRLTFFHSADLADPSHSNLIFCGTLFGRAQNGPMMIWVCLWS